ncbi:hypothetical protein GH714_018488 [Hevea brasiliensis]|uniref:Phytocyanin domain-containing protein n=1 Tax=Hevea brasiliensis TaxID=3981 RepID=A0A6A6N2U9_HEVBR|nr:hypothetical protein GH714_018488 [Hevea brasiliensis]
MAKAREGEILAILALFLMLLLLHFKTTQAATYTVGDGLGWCPDVSMESWPENKKFYSGDTLVFNYDADSYDVVVVDQRGHDTCTVTANAKVFDSGHDQIKLVFGANYFITSNPEDCQLVFNYDYQLYNVVMTDQVGYNSCTITTILKFLNPDMIEFILFSEKITS